MCGIVGHVGHQLALDIAVDALRRMEYRGYDSVGAAIVDNQGHITVEKKVGKLANFEAVLDADGCDKITGTIGTGHTRWATHGRPVDESTHPHQSYDGKMAIVHNGIVENLAPLCQELEDAGTELKSETDFEVAVHMLVRALDGFDGGSIAGDFEASALSVLNHLEGAFTLLLTHADHPDRITAACRSIPPIAGVGENEMFLSSDVAAFIMYTCKAVELGQDNVVIITADSYYTLDFAGNEQQGRPFVIGWDPAAAEKGGYDPSMMKEIHEQAATVRDTLAGHLVDGRAVLDESRLSDQDLRDIERVLVVVCSAAHHSGLLVKYTIEYWVRIPVEIGAASELRYRDPVLDRQALVVAISQSGETADTLEAVRHAKNQGARVPAVCNTNGAQIPRESDAVLCTYVGPEIGVAATKSLLAQVVANYLVGLALAQAYGTKYPDEVTREFEELEIIPALIDKVVAKGDKSIDMAKEIGAIPTMLFLGRHVGFPVALEGALKLKELAYAHAEGFPVGELKHDPVAPIEDDPPAVVVVPSPKGRAVLHSKVVSNIQEIRARGAKTIVIAEEGDQSAVPFASYLIRAPETFALLQPLLSTIPMQFLIAEIARQRGNEDIDGPCNLAKPITVE